MHEQAQQTCVKPCVAYCLCRISGEAGANHRGIHAQGPVNRDIVDLLKNVYLEQTCLSPMLFLDYIVSTSRTR